MIDLDSSLLGSLCSISFIIALDTRCFGKACRPHQFLTCPPVHSLIVFLGPWSSPSLVLTINAFGKHAVLLNESAIRVSLDGAIADHRHSFLLYFSHVSLFLLSLLSSKGSLLVCCCSSVTLNGVFSLLLLLLLALAIQICLHFLLLHHFLLLSLLLKPLLLNFLAGKLLIALLLPLKLPVDDIFSLKSDSMG